MLDGLPPIHDIIEPAIPQAQTELVYPQLIELDRNGVAPVVAPYGAAGAGAKRRMTASAAHRNAAPSSSPPATSVR